MAAVDPAHPEPRMITLRTISLPPGVGFYRCSVTGGCRGCQGGCGFGKRESGGGMRPSTWGKGEIPRCGWMREEGAACANPAVAAERNKVKTRIREEGRG